MNGMTKFQLILTGTFGVFLLVGILIFAVARPGGGGKVPVVLWGSIPKSSMDSLLMQLPIGKSKEVAISYRYVPESDFDTEFIEALASGKGPDVVLIAQDGFLKHKDKFVLIPYESYGQRTFTETFAEAGELFLDVKGFYAFPLFIDPLVMYWNRDIFTSASMANPPQYWDEFYDLSSKLTEKESALTVKKATVALGEYSNVTNAKEIISALMLQAGTPIVAKDSLGYNSMIAHAMGKSVNLPSVSAVNFYTEFSNVSKPHYSWNRSLPESQTMFLSGDLAVYLGFATERGFLKLKNPNLNFSVAPLPQVRSEQRKTTFGRIQGLAVVKSTKNIPAAITAISGMVNKEAAAMLSAQSNTPPARRDLLSVRQSESSMSVFYESALWARGWLDPDRAATTRAFRDMIESITGGRARTSEAITRLDTELTNLLKKVE
jgi:ABC-type glycerol-3-phosphate transport system substrate-binding protein